MKNNLDKNIDSNLEIKMTEHTINTNADAKKSNSNTSKNNLNKQINNYPSDIQRLFECLGIE